MCGLMSAEDPVIGGGWVGVEGGYRLYLITVNTVNGGIL